MIDSVFAYIWYHSLVLYGLGPDPLLFIYFVGFIFLDNFRFKLWGKILNNDIHEIEIESWNLRTFIENDDTNLLRLVLWFFVAHSERNPQNSRVHAWHDLKLKLQDFVVKIWGFFTRMIRNPIMNETHKNLWAHSIEIEQSGL